MEEYERQNHALQNGKRSEDGGSTVSRSRGRDGNKYSYVF